jgi:hypothetical protein
MKHLYIWLIAFVLVDITQDQLFAQGGTSAVPFLLISPNSRASGMGEGGTGIADDASAIHWNPGGLAYSKGSEISITHANWLPAFHLTDLFYDYLNYKQHVPEWGGTIAASVTYLNLGEFVQTGERDPTPLGTFKSFEYAVTLGYGTKVTEDLGIGVNLRFINSRLSPIGTGQEKGDGIAYDFSFDIGAMYRPKVLSLPGGLELGDRFSVGMNLSNIGPKVTYIDAAQADPLPTQLRLGFGIVPMRDEYNSFTIAIDFSRLIVQRDSISTDPVWKAMYSSWTQPSLNRVLKSINTSVGFEYWYNNLIALRMGYFYEDPQMGNRNFLTFGAGIRYDIYGFDFSYISAKEENSPLSDTLRFTLLILWDAVN